MSFGGDNPSDPTTEVPAGMTLARLSRRALGQLLDQVIVAVPVVVVALIADIRIYDEVSDNEMFALNTAYIALAFVYEFVMVGMLGRTVGKMAAGTIAVRVDDGSKLPWSSAAIRALVPLAAGAIPGVGAAASLVVYMTAFFDPRYRGLHDKACGSIVVMHQRS